MQLTGQHIIGFSLSKGSKATFTAVNPITGERLTPPFHEATDEELDQAAKVAEEAFPHYHRTSREEKAAFLNAIADEIMSLENALIVRCHEETALPEARLVSERTRTVNQLRLFADLVLAGWWVEARIDTAIPNRQPLPKPDVRQVLIPLGPVGVFCASNFPLAFSVAGGDTASALAAGCPVIVKAHPAHPGTSELTGRAILSAARATRMPDGVFSLIHGQSPAVGLGLVNHPLVRAVAFTGSYQAGKALYDAAALRDEPIPLYAEMGSTNPVFILPGALEKQSDAIAQGLFNAVTLGVGQFCTNPGLFFVIDSDGARDFIAKLAHFFTQSNAGTMLSNNISRNYDEGVGRLARLEGVAIIAFGKKDTGTCQGTPCLLQTSTDALMRFQEIAEEVFGPCSVAVAADSREALIEAAQHLAGHLTAAVFGADHDLMEFTDLLEILAKKAGRLIINDFPTGVEVCHAMHHGGPFPATTDLRSTSVGTASIKRFVRPLCYQNAPQAVLPPPLQNHNPLNIWRLVNGEWTKEPIR